MDISPYLDLPAFRKRASKPKTRLGCTTCKTRRVKCDETKPVCLRCVKFGHKCEGYPDAATLKRGPPEPQVVIHKLLPKPPQIEAHLSMCKSVNIYRSYCSMNERDGHFLQLYHQNIASELSGGFEGILWNRIVLQACENDSIRQLTIATAALKQSARVESGSADELIKHREYALQKYSQAVKTLQKQLSMDHGNIRVVLLAALLIFVLESIFRDTKTAFKHVQIALEMINHRLIIKSSFPKHSGGGAQQNSLVEDEVLKSFMLLDKGAIGLLRRHMGSRPVEIPILSPRLYLKGFEVPRRFTSIEEARYCYECIRFRIFSEPKFEKKLTPSISLLEEATSPAILLMRLVSELGDNHLAPLLRAKLAQWLRAFAPLIQHSRKPQGRSTFIPAITLYIQATALEIPLYGFIAGHLDAPSTMSDPIMSTRKLLAHARDLVSNPQYPKCFVFDIGIIPSLWIIVVLCLDVSLKKEALTILRQMQPRIECVFDSRVMADVGDAFVNIVEQMQKDHGRCRHYYQGNEGIERFEITDCENEELHKYGNMTGLQGGIIYFGSSG